MEYIIINIIYMTLIYNKLYNKKKFTCINTFIFVTQNLIFSQKKFDLLQFTITLNYKFPKYS